MEKMPSQETLPTKEVIIERIRSEGKTEDVILLIKTWYEAMRKSENSGLDTARTQVELADFYIELGDIEDAVQTLNDAMYMAKQEGDQDLYLFAESKLDSLG